MMRCKSELYSIFADLFSINTEERHSIPPVLTAMVDYV